LFGRSIMVMTISVSALARASPMVTRTPRKLLQAEVESVTLRGTDG
jgi:hypothetical protein